MVLIAESTRRLVGNLFEFEDLGTREIKGMAEPVRAYAAVRASSVESRFEALHASGLTALVGREEELKLLVESWSKAKNSRGQVVLLSGEAGIGKSRLTAELLKRLAAEPHVCLRYFCSPQHTDSVLHPIIGQLERAAGLTRDDSPQTKLDKLDAMLAQSSASAQDAALIAEVLSLPNDGRYPALDLTAQQRRQKTLEALTAQVEALTRKRPVLQIFEDAHWADPTSLELLGRAVDRVQTFPVLLIVTARPEFQPPPWIARPHVGALTLNRLTEREVDTIIDRILGNRRLPASIRQDIIERTDGIPLFVEEMTKAVLEAEHEGSQIVAAVPPPAQVVPASLHASLMARLDRLGPAKDVAQIGAAIGREFSHPVLAAVVRTAESELRSALDRLIAAGLVFRQGVAPHATYLFKHALVQDAAYGTLLRERRHALHARIAETLEDQFTGIAENQPELLARHCAQAGLIEKAASLWGKAGHRSLERSAFAEAAEQLTQALTLIAALPASSALRRTEIKLQVALVNALMYVRGYAAPETKAAAERARLLIEQAQALGEPPEDPLLLFSVLYSFWVANTVAFNGDVCCDLSTHFLALAEKQGARVPLMIGHRLKGTSLLCTGDIAAGRTHLDRAIMLYDPMEHRPLATRFGQDIRVVLLSWLSVALWVLGYPDAAFAVSARALSDAREIGQAASLMYALTTAALTHVHAGNYAAAKMQSDEAVALAGEKSAVYWKSFALMNQGWLSAANGKAEEAVHTITSAIASYRSTGATLLTPLYVLHLATAYAEVGQFEDAARCVGEALRGIERSKESWMEAEAHRIAGEVALMSPGENAARAEAYFENALAIASAQQAKSWELRAATSMARLWRDQGRQHKARELLAPVYGWFTEGFDTPDLKEAKALLCELSS
jgi:predicted ATPase